MKAQSKYLPVLAAAALTSLTFQAAADVVTDWNQITLTATKTGGFNSNLGTRIGAIEAIAVYDAVNSIQQFGTPYHYNVAPAGPASADAAAARAAHDVLAYYFPAQQTNFASSHPASLAAIPDGPEKVNGQNVGAAAAADIIALRANDGSSPNFSYPGPAVPGVGEWRPTPPALANATSSATLVESS